MVNLRNRRVSKKPVVVEPVVEEDEFTSDDDVSETSSDTSRAQRELMRPWLIKQIAEGGITGLEWLNKDKSLVKIPWTHGSRHGFDLKKDSCLFKRWAVHTGKFKESSKCNAKRWKANFRCAMNSLPDVEEDRCKSKTKGSHAYKVYRFLPAKNARPRHGKKKNGKESTEASYRKYTTNADRLEMLKKLKQTSESALTIEQSMFYYPKVQRKARTSSSLSTCTSTSDVSGHMTETSSECSNEETADSVVPGYNTKVTPAHVKQATPQHVPAGYSPQYYSDSSPQYMYSSSPSPADGFGDFSKEHSYACQGPIPSVVESHDECDVEWALSREDPLHISRVFEQVQSIIELGETDSRRSSIEKLFTTMEYESQTPLTPEERLLFTVPNYNHVSMETSSQCSSSGWGSEAESRGSPDCNSPQDLRCSSLQEGYGSDSGMEEMLGCSQGSTMSQLLHDASLDNFTSFLECSGQSFQQVNAKVTVEQVSNVPYEPITTYAAQRCENLVPLTFEKM